MASYQIPAIETLTSLHQASGQARFAASNIFVMFLDFL